MSEKVTGYALLGIGLLIIAYAGLSVFMVFTARWEPASLFNFPAVSFPISALVGEGMPVDPSASVELLPANVMNKTTNVLAHLFLMGFLVTLGAKVASTGTYLIRPIIIKAKSEQNAVTQKVDA